MHPLESKKTESEIIFFTFVEPDNIEEKGNNVRIMFQYFRFQTKKT